MVFGKKFIDKIIKQDNKSLDLNRDTLEEIRDLMDENFERFIIQYLTVAEQHVRTAAEAYRATDYKTLHSAVHTLRSSSASIGAEKLADIASKIEDATANMDDHTAQVGARDISMLKTCYSKTRSLLEKEIAAP